MRADPDVSFEEPRLLLVRARSEPSPLYEPYEGGGSGDLDVFTLNVPLDDSRFGLPKDLADALNAWSSSRPAEGFPSRPHLRKHVKQGLAVARMLARHLGPAWAVRHWDERHRSAKWVCWGCDRLHWERDSHGTPPHPLDLVVEGEFGSWPLRAEKFGNFAPDDPAAALHLSDGLVADLYTWATAIDTTLNLHIRDRQDDRHEPEWERLFREGKDLARRLAHELGPARKVTYKGLANGGLAALTYLTWRGDREV